MRHRTAATLGADPSVAAVYSPAEWAKKLRDTGFRVEFDDYDLVIHPVPAWQCEAKREPYRSLFTGKTK